MLRKFKITIDGKEYLVEMEEIGASTAPVASPVAAPVEAPAPAPTPAAPPVEAPAPAVAPSAPAGDEAIKAPMPGTILKILVNVGDQVTQNQPIMILEAMKMENEIVAPADGTVAGIHVSQGQVVNPGDGLLTIS